jgi:excinuclease ABC subunit C
VAGTFQFEQKIGFEPERAAEILRSVPTQPGVFALRGERDSDEPYLTRTADLRRRMTRLLNPPEEQSKRLNLRDRVRTIEYSVTGSEFESHLVLYDAASAIFGHAEARRRLRLHTPFFLRLTMEHTHPRVYSTNRLSRRGLAQTYGPFASRASAERYCDAVLDLFKLRRCHEDLDVSPEHPGCAYGEMKKCMAPCNMTSTAEEYGAEARAVEAFFRTHGESMLGAIGVERDRASSEMEFEKAAGLHEQFQRVKAAAALADELVGPVLELRAVVVQGAALGGGVGGGLGGPTHGEMRHEWGTDLLGTDLLGQGVDRQEAAVFMLEGGCLAGPERLSTLGVRAVKEQTSVGSSLFAQPLMLQAIPIGEETGAAASDSPEVRAEQVLGRLAARLKPGADRAADRAADRGADLAMMGDHLSLLRRWYYRPEKQRVGEVFLANADGSWPVRRILRGAARMVIGEPKVMAETERDKAPAAKMKILHEGREGVERAVPVVTRPGRVRKAKAGADPAPESAAAVKDDSTEG